MSTSVMIAALRQGKTGEEILNILETLTQSEQQTDAQVPTLEWIDF